MIREELSREDHWRCDGRAQRIETRTRRKTLRTCDDRRTQAPRTRVSVQSSFPVYYRGEVIGNLVPDLIVDDAVIVDPKVVSCFTDTHVAQMIGYLNITGLDLALLINFKNARLEWKRVLRPQEPDEARSILICIPELLIRAICVIRG